MAILMTPNMINAVTATLIIIVLNMTLRRFCEFTAFKNFSGVTLAAASAKSDENAQN